MDKRGFNYAEAATYTGLAENKIRTRVRERKIPARYEGKDVLILREDLDLFLDSLQSERVA